VHSIRLINELKKPRARRDEPDNSFNFDSLMI
jgi:hypothetical protein